jgi:hypothetical protein
VTDHTDESDLRKRLHALGREVYGADYETFLNTPRRSLGGETPAALLERGEDQRVLEVLVRALEGSFG